MIYAKLDVTLAHHPRAHKAGRAMATWAWMLAYTRDQELDGFIPDEVLRLAWVGLRQAKKDAETLVSVGLATREPHGYRLRAYEEKNDTKAVIDARREDARERMRGVRARVRANAGRTDGERSPEVPGSGSGSGSVLSVPDREGDPSSPSRPATARGRLVEVGTAAAEEAAHAYASAVGDAQGSPFSLPARAPRMRQALADAVNAHSGATTLADALAWLQGAARAYVGAVLAADARAFHLGYPPERFLAWVASGRPSLRAPPRAGAVVQPADDRCWTVPTELT